MLIKKISLDIFLDCFALKPEVRYLMVKKMQFLCMFMSSKLSLRFQGFLGFGWSFFSNSLLYFLETLKFSNSLQVVLIKICHLVAEDKSS